MIKQSKIRLMLVAGLFAGTLFVGSPNAQAQPPGGMPPGRMQKLKAWQKWDDQHKKLTLLGDQFFQIEQINAEPAYSLSKGQAGKMLQILNPWRLRTTMTEDQASGLNKQIGNVLTTGQIKRMTQIEPPSVTMKKRGFGGGRPGGGGPRPGGNPGERGSRPGGRPNGGRPDGAGPRPPGRPGGGPPGGFNLPDPPRFGWNPLNADTIPFAQGRPETKRRAQTFFAALQHKAHS